MLSLLAGIRTEEARALRAAGDGWQDTGLVFTNHLGAALDAGNVRKMFRKRCWNGCPPAHCRRAGRTTVTATVALPARWPKSSGWRKQARRPVPPAERPDGRGAVTGHGRRAHPPVVSTASGAPPSQTMVSAPYSGVRTIGRVSARNTGIQLRTQPLAANPRQAAGKK